MASNTRVDVGTGNSLEEKEFTIRLRPWKLLKFSLFLILLLGVFFLGRWSINPPELGLNGLITGNSTLGIEKTAETAATEVKTAVPETPKTTVTEVVAPVTAAAVVATVNDTANSLEALEANETIITKYTKVNLELINANVEWKETWGKVMRIGYRISNNEAGTIKPAKLEMLMEGYEDLTKEITLPASAKIIKAGQSYAGINPLVSGFAYASKATGDLATVKITLVLKDAKGIIIATTSKDMDLRGK